MLLLFVMASPHLVGVSAILNSDHQYHLKQAGLNNVHHLYQTKDKKLLHNEGAITWHKPLRPWGCHTSLSVSLSLKQYNNNNGRCRQGERTEMPLPQGRHVNLLLLSS